jgi:hypothetical protein
MPSDLDFLEEVSVVRRWVGFRPLLRNPFTVPMPMENGLLLFSEVVAAPSHVEQGKVDAFFIGGLSASMVCRVYAPRTTHRPPARLSSSAASPASCSPSYLLNADMRRLRACEYVLLKEEERCGRYRLDPGGRLAPEAVALSKCVTEEMGLDDGRMMDNGATVSVQLAPFAVCNFCVPYHCLHPPHSLW